MGTGMGQLGKVEREKGTFDERENNERDQATRLMRQPGPFQWKKYYRRVTSVASGPLRPGPSTYSTSCPSCTD